jgi:hypothetical protein
MTTLGNTDITKFDEKLKIYNMNFFSVINGAEGLLSETTSIRDTVSLNIPTTSAATTYSTAQFATFIKKIVNFNIKNYDEAAAALNDKDLCFITKAANGTITSNDNNRDNIISTLKVVNVFVDILEAYKYCIDKAEDATFDSGYRQDVFVNRIEIVSDKTRFYSGASNATMTPSANDRNVGYIRTVTVNGIDTKVLFLSIQSYKTSMITPANKYNYDDLFTYSGTSELADNTNILTDSSIGTKSPSVETYKYQRYESADDTATILTTGLTLAERNKNLIKLLIRTLYGLDITFRKQSVYSLYYYYKFVQLYSTFIIHVSNVMYNDVKKTSGETASPFTIETYNMTTNKKTHGVSAFEKQYLAGKTATDKLKITDYRISPAAGDIQPKTAATIAADGGTSGSESGVTQGTIVRGKGYQQNPTVVLTPSTVERGRLTIVPVVYADTTITNDNNITRLEDVITEINDTVNLLLDELATYDDSTTLNISTVSADPAAEKTAAYPSSDKLVTINVKMPRIYNKLVIFNDLFDIVKDYIIYDKIHKYSYDIISIENTGMNDFKIKINAVFAEADKGVNQNARLYKDASDIAVSPTPTEAAPAIISHTGEFLELRMKDTNSYKTDYITTRNDISKLETDINFKSSKVTHQKNLYESQNNKKIFLERQILAYNIIIAVIVLILVGINVVKVDKEVVRTVSLSCFGVIILLFVIYFISNLTYVETFAAYPSGKQLYDLSFTSFTADAAAESTYKTKKIKKLNAVISTLNAKFINYFEKLIITLPAADNYQFYKEISEIITNDKENKTFTNNSLDYSKNQNDNNINSIKYELENNKLYINTLLISAVIFIGLYNMYINYIKDDKYLTLFVFVCFIIFIVILSYYYITANRRVKTVFKSIYWGPEFSKRF